MIVGALVIAFSKAVKWLQQAVKTLANLALQSCKPTLTTATSSYGVGRGKINS